jgi:hypothetical protein
MRRWELESESYYETFRGHTRAVTSISVSPDAAFAVSGSEDKSLILWDLKTGQSIRTFEGHGDAVAQVLYAPDRQLIASAGMDAVVRLWRLDWEPEIMENTPYSEQVTPFLKLFLERNRPSAAGGLTRRGKPSWSDEDFEALVRDLAHRGFSWVDPKGVRNKLKTLAGRKKSLGETLNNLKNAWREMDFWELTKRAFKGLIYIIVRLIPAAIVGWVLWENDLMGLSPPLAVIIVLFVIFIMFAKPRRR